MILPFTHPNLDELAEFSASALAPRRRDAIAAHLLNCVRCQESLRFVRRLKEAAPQLPEAALPQNLMQRVLEARAGGARYILPATATRSTTRTRGRTIRLAAAVAAAITVVVVFGRAELVAEATDSELRVQPAQPRAGDTIDVTYRPAAGLFPPLDSLVLRARLRTRADAMYSSGVPASQVRAIAGLRRARNGEYRGRFVLPPSVVFASLAVETQDASVVDANGTRLWEVLTHGADGRPTFEALDQRINDMMGRSWEEGYATAKRRSELYPNRIRSWSTLAFFERALFGPERADSAGKAYKARLENLVAAAKSQATLDVDEIGTVFYNAAVETRKPNATDAEKREFQYWWDRIRREWPRHPQVAQHLAFDFTKEQWQREPRFILDSLEHVYPRMAPLAGPGRNLANAGMQAANQAKDGVAYRRWLERSLAAEGDSTARLANALAARPEFRSEGLTLVRALLVARPEALVPTRGITSNAAEYNRRVDDARRRALLVLGRALIADGRTRAGLDTLSLAARGVWDVQAFRSLVAGYLAAGDTANAQRIRVRLAVDPRTDTATAAAIVQEGRARLGAAGWDSATAVARAEMHALVRERSKLKALRGIPRVTDAQGKTRGLDELTGGRPAVVIFWSRNCGYAIEALPSIIEVAQRLVAAGTPVIFVNDAARTKEVADFLAEKNWTLPVYYDSRGEMGEAFNNFGTPQYFVLDSSGRIRFDFVVEVPELLSQVGSLNN